MGSTEVAVEIVARRRPNPSLGKANVLREETGVSTLGEAGVWVQTRRERMTEIATGRAIAQQGLAATCKDLESEDKPRMKGAQRSGA
jgi:hypothetical protein